MVVVAILVALACVVASARRLWFAANPTALHPDDVVALIDKQGEGTYRDGPALDGLRARIADIPEADWEQQLFDALRAPTNDARVALVNEQLTELDMRAMRWDRVPRVCASIATSAGIMLGTLVLRNGLASSPDLAGEAGERFVRAILNDAISVAAFGIVGTAFCIAAHAQARRLSRAHLAAADRMIEKLETIASR